MALTKITKDGIGAQAIEKDGIKTDAIDATRIADDAISEEHLDVTAITGNTELSAVASADDVLLVFDTSSSTLKKIQASNINSAPTITSISPTNVNEGDGTGNHTFVITGTNFNASATAFLKKADGTEVAFSSVTRNSATQLTGIIAKSTLVVAGEPYDIVVENPNGQQATKRNQLNINASPVFVTAAGSLATVNGGASVNASVNATDPESAGNVTFEIQSGALPAGISLVNTAAEGGTAIISGTATNPGGNTTSNFVLRAVDAASNTSSRAFSITVNRVYSQTSFTSSGTFAVPSGTTSLDAVLVIAGGGSGGGDNGGGGGAGGVIFMPAYPVTPGGTIAITVGCGGATAAYTGNTGQDSTFGASPSPGKHPSGDVLTAKGGGHGYVNPGYTGGDGGSGGGANGHANNTGGGTGTQPTQPGDSGAYGFGSQGGNASPGTMSGSRRAGGGGGAGGAGGNGGNYAAQGGPGKAYTIADGTSPVYYAGGGGGGTCAPNTSGQGGSGGGGGGGSPSGASGSGAPDGAAGQANTGSGGGGGSNGGHDGGAGGKGIVIVRY